MFQFNFFKVDCIKNYGKHIPREKIVIGISALFLPVVVIEKKNNKLNSPLNSKNPISKRFNNFKGVSFYLNISNLCQVFLSMQLCEEAAKGGVTVVHNETGKVNSYAFKDADWVSYDSSVGVKTKVCVCRF